MHYVLPLNFNPIFGRKPYDVKKNTLEPISQDPSFPFLHCFILSGGHKEGAGPATYRQRQDTPLSKFRAHHEAPSEHLGVWYLGTLLVRVLYASAAHASPLQIEPHLTSSNVNRYIKS